MHGDSKARVPIVKIRRLLFSGDLFLSNTQALVALWYMLAVLCLTHLRASSSFRELLRCTYLKAAAGSRGVASGDANLNSIVLRREAVRAGAGLH